MTVETESIVPFDYTLDGVTRVFTVPFRVMEDDHLQVFLVDEDGNETNLVVDDDYSLEIQEGVEEAELTLATAAGTSGKRLVGVRNIPLTRTTVLNPGPFPARRVDDDLDTIVMQMQQLRELIGRAVLLPVGSTTRGVRLPSYQAGKYLRWSTTTEDVLTNDDATVEGGGNGGEDPEQTNVTTRYPDDANLSTASGFDNSKLLNDYLDEMSAGGGGKFVLESPTGAAYYFEHGIRVPSFVTLECVSGIKVGARGTVSIAGDREYAHTGVRLVSDGSEGANTLIVDTAPVGGGAVSSLFKVGGGISIVGLRSGAGVPIHQEANTVTAIDDGTRQITLANDLLFDYEAEYPDGDYEEAFGVPNRTEIAVAAVGRITLDTTLRSNLVTVNAADLATLSVDQWVMVEDDTRATGGDTTIRIEIAQILAIGVDGANVVTLNRKLRRVYQVAENARLTVLDPARRASIIGASIEYTEEAEPDLIIPTFEMRYCVDCLMVDCEVPNLDAFGSRGQMFRVHKSYNSHFIRPTGRNPGFTEEGEGNGVVIAYSTICSTSQPVMEGCRHAVEFIASTECAAEEITATDCRLTPVDFHGLNSVGCYATQRMITFSNRTASASNGVGAFGNSTWIEGDHECVIMNGSIGPFEGGSGVYGYRAFPPSSRCFVINVQAKNVAKFFIHRDIAGHGTLKTTDCGILDCAVDGGSDRVIDLQGRQAGASVDTLEGFVIRDFDAQGLFRGLYAEDVTDLLVHDVRLKFSSPDAVSERSAMRFNDVTGLRVMETVLHKGDRGIRFQDCPGALFLNCHILDQDDTEWLRDDGGNDGTEFRGCNAYTADGDAVTSVLTGGSTIVYKAVSNIGTETTAAYEFSDTDLLLARVSSGAGTGEEVPFTDAGQALVAAATHHAQHKLLQVDGGTIASASTVNLSAATGHAVTISGTTTITSFGTVDAGRLFHVTFSGALQLTHNGTSFILPGGSNITTAAGDTIWALSKGSGNWKLFGFSRSPSTGTMASQDASNVNISGGTISLSSALPIASGGTGATGARSAMDALSTKGTDVASASTINIGTGADGHYINITGTTTITAIQNPGGSGDWRRVKFTGSLTLTHSANLVLPTGANIQTAAGDTALFVYDGSSVWICAWYQRAAGTNVMTATELKTHLGLRDGAIEFAFDGAGADIAVGTQVAIEVPYDCIVVGWTFAALQTGSIVVDLWKDTYANWPPTDADSIAGSELPTISASNKGQDLSLSSWTTALTKGDWIIANVDSCTGVHAGTLSVRVQR